MCLCVQVNFSDFELKDILRIEFYTERTSCPDGKGSSTARASIDQMECMCMCTCRQKLFYDMSLSNS